MSPEPPFWEAEPCAQRGTMTAQGPGGWKLRKENPGFRMPCPVLLPHILIATLPETPEGGGEAASCIGGWAVHGEAHLDVLHSAGCPSLRRASQWTRKWKSQSCALPKLPVHGASYMHSSSQGQAHPERVRAAQRKDSENGRDVVAWQSAKTSWPTEWRKVTANRGTHTAKAPRWGSTQDILVSHRCDDA